MISQTQEDYLRALYVLDEEHSSLKSSEVARYLNVSKPTVSEMMRSLKLQGLVHAEPYSKITFTKKGKEVAANLTAKHRIIEMFLKKKLNRKDSEIHEEAHQLEHAFSDESIKALRKLLGNPKTDPHGKPIPR